MQRVRYIVVYRISHVYSQRSLVQFFQPSHAAQLETIPGIKDMIAKFK